MADMVYIQESFDKIYERMDSTDFEIFRLKDSIHRWVMAAKWLSTEMAESRKVLSKEKSKVRKRKQPGRASKRKSIYGKRK